MNGSVIQVSSYEMAELVKCEIPQELPDTHIYGRTLFSAVSPGTELASAYRAKNFPAYPGYASVFRVEKCGKSVTSFRTGDIAFTMGSHRSFQLADAGGCLRVPDGLPPERAVLARLMGISMTSLITTKARSGDKVLVSGLGPVGNLCAQIFAASGYFVTAVDISAKKRAFLDSCSIKTFETVPDDMKGTFQLGIDCSGHEQAVLNAADSLEKGSELVLIGVPWKKQTEIFAYDLLHIIFYRYICLRSGWEWEIPMHCSDFHSHSIFKNLLTAMEWMKSGKIKTESLTSFERPENCQCVYQALLKGEYQALFPVFKWSEN